MMEANPRSPSPEWVEVALEELRSAAWSGRKGRRGLREAVAGLGVTREALDDYLRALDERASAGVPAEGGR